MKPVLSLILPAYHEEATLQRAVQESRSVLSSLSTIEDFEIIIVNDGSKDDTAKIARSLVNDRVHFFSHDVNRGKGAAIQTGIAHAQGEVIAFLDCDLSVYPDVFTRLSFRSLPDVLIGSRRVQGATIERHQSWYWTIGGRFFNAGVRAFLSLPYHDTQCGFKVFLRQAAERIFSDISVSGWIFDVEVLLRAQQFGFSIQEMPVNWVNGTESRVRLAHGFGIVRDLWRLKRKYKQ